MALIFRVSNEQEAPNWYQNDGSGLPKDINSISEEEIARIASLPEDLDENSLVGELDIIEARGQSGETYHYSSSWNDEAKNTIKEYAIVSKCRAIEVNSSDKNLQEFASLNRKSGNLEKTASVATVNQKDGLNGTFLLDIPFEQEKDESAVSEGLKGLSKARTGMPAIEARGTTISRTYSLNDDDMAGIGIRATPGRNVIQDPDSIERSANSKEEDVGVRLRRERAEREQIRKAIAKSEQKKLVKEMEAAGHGSLKSGNFRLSEVANVQGGVAKRINRSIPDLTEGEKIMASHMAKENAKMHKKAVAKKQWNFLSGSKKPEISDDLANALKAEIGKMK